MKPVQPENYEINEINALICIQGLNKYLQIKVSRSSKNTTKTQVSFSAVPLLSVIIKVQKG